MRNAYSVADHYLGSFDEEALRRWAEQLRAQLPAPRVSLGLVFLAPRFFPQASQVLEILRVHAQIPLLAGCSSGALIASAHEWDEDPGIVVGLYSLPGADLRTFVLTQAQVEAADEPEHWVTATGIPPAGTNGWLVFADPFHLDCERWLRGWNQAYAPLPVVGGLASGKAEEPATQVYLNGDVLDSGGVAISVGGDVSLTSVISQGCTPIGETWTITKADRNFVHEIGNRPAYEVLVETFNGLSPETQQHTRGNLFIGLVVNEYLEEFQRGDFLIRNLLGVDPRSGSIAVGALPRAGQTMQFQRRDAAAATEDMAALLTRTRGALQSATIYGGCLCSCNGRGRRLFGKPDHDPSLVQRHLGPMGLAGFFCNGELGPVGDRSFLHGYTASLALFTARKCSGQSK